MNADRAQRILKAITVVSFAIALVALLGELRGWWNDIGEVAITVATIVGAVGGIATLLVGSTSDEVRNVGDEVRDVGSEVRDVGSEVQRVGRGVDQVRDAVDENGDTLASVDGRLEKLDELDVIQAELDHQTGAMDRQVEILTAIRDEL